MLELLAQALNHVADPYVSLPLGAPQVQALGFSGFESLLTESLCSRKNSSRAVHGD